jgi:L-alanine-DL-glutamate epimerase-like enolase superfamily enzyme
MSIIDSPYDFLECGVEFTNWEESAYLNAPAISGGMAKIPDNPGWGLVLNDEWFKKSEYQISKL